MESLTNCPTFYLGEPQEGCSITTLHKGTVVVFWTSNSSWQCWSVASSAILSRTVSQSFRKKQTTVSLHCWSEFIGLLSSPPINHLRGERSEVKEPKEMKELGNGQWMIPFEKLKRGIQTTWRGSCIPFTAGEGGRRKQISNPPCCGWGVCFNGMQQWWDKSHHSWCRNSISVPLPNLSQMQTGPHLFTSPLAPLQVAEIFSLPAVCHWLTWQLPALHWQINRI